MPTLHLGVNDIPYADPDPQPHKAAKARRGKANKPRRKSKTGTETTGDVATFIENKYHLMQTFFDQNDQVIADAFANGMAGAIEDLISGAPIRDPFAGINAEVTAGFQAWLTLGLDEEAGIEGVPTKAALERRSLRFKNKRGPNRRPSFIDTGAYEGSFQAWITDK